MEYRDVPDSEETPEPESETEPSPVEQCRICFESAAGGPLRYPCACRGTIGAVHESCLVSWLSASHRSHCDVCGVEYRWEVHLSPDAPQLTTRQLAVGMLRRAAATPASLVMHAVGVWLSYKACEWLMTAVAWAAAVVLRGTVVSGGWLLSGLPAANLLLLALSIVPLPGPLDAMRGWLGDRLLGFAGSLSLWPLEQVARYQLGRFVLLPLQPMPHSWAVRALVGPTEITSFAEQFIDEELGMGQWAVLELFRGLGVWAVGLAACVVLARLLRPLRVAAYRALDSPAVGWMPRRLLARTFLIELLRFGETTTEEGEAGARAGEEAAGIDPGRVELPINAWRLYHSVLLSIASLLLNRVLLPLLLTPPLLWAPARAAARWGATLDPPLGLAECNVADVVSALFFGVGVNAIGLLGALLLATAILLSISLGRLLRAVALARLVAQVGLFDDILPPELDLGDFARSLLFSPFAAVRRARRLDAVARLHEAFWRGACSLLRLPPSSSGAALLAAMLTTRLGAACRLRVVLVAAAAAAAFSLLRALHLLASLLLGRWIWNEFFFDGTGDSSGQRPQRVYGPADPEIFDGTALLLGFASLRLLSGLAEGLLRLAAALPSISAALWRVAGRAVSPARLRAAAPRAGVALALAALTLLLGSEAALLAQAVSRLCRAAAARLGAADLDPVASAAAALRPLALSMLVYYPLDVLLAFASGISSPTEKGYWELAAMDAVELDYTPQWMKGELESQPSADDVQRMLSSIGALDAPRVQLATLRIDLPSLWWLGAILMVLSYRGLKHLLPLDGGPAPPWLLCLHAGLARGRPQPPAFFTRLLLLPLLLRLGALLAAPWAAALALDRSGLPFDATFLPLFSAGVVAAAGCGASTVWRLRMPVLRDAVRAEVFGAALHLRDFQTPQPALQTHEHTD